MEKPLVALPSCDRQYVLCVRAFVIQQTRYASCLLIAVLFICGEFVMVVFVHRGVGPPLFLGRFCAGARINAEKHASPCLHQ